MQSEIHQALVNQLHSHLSANQDPLSNHSLQTSPVMSRATISQNHYTLPRVVQPRKLLSRKGRSMPNTMSNSWAEIETTADDLRGGRKENCHMKAFVESRQSEIAAASLQCTMRRCKLPTLVLPPPRKPFRPPCVMLHGVQSVSQRSQFHAPSSPPKIEVAESNDCSDDYENLQVEEEDDNDYDDVVPWESKHEEAAKGVPSLPSAANNSSPLSTTFCLHFRKEEEDDDDYDDVVPWESKDEEEVK
uniref:uncharacterized protein n=1 Tax=Myxine glutinosa TaxID=7769 RepID=UPI00358E6884